MKPPRISGRFSFVREEYMRLDDLFGHAERGLGSLVKLALCPLVLVVVFQMASALLSQLSAIDMFFVLVVLVFVSPVAYFARQSRQGRSERRNVRRGHERTPMLPQNWEEQ
jgi:hypothetical protein